MDAYEATRIVLSRIQKVDPENASRIMGLLLIQDHGEKEMIRLAFGPESLLHSVILKSRNDLGLSSTSPPTPSTPLSASPFFSRHGSSRLLVPTPDSPNCYNINSSPLPFYNATHHDVMELSFLNEDGDGWGHRRSCSVNDADDPSSGFGWKPCLYYARGFCKNGGSCRFLHGGDADFAASPPAMPHHQRLAAAFPYSPKSINLLLQQKDSQIRRNELMVSPASRQIYLTFPADSSFREEDVSNYFSIYGPVQDVRIPYQQKRMFGFVTFVYPETVKLILAKGNPHFVCDARVLVKPYKEKPKLTLSAPENNNNNCRKQQMERGGDFSPSALDSFDLSSPGGGSMFYNSSQDMMWTRKMEEQALEVQSRRLMNLQLLDVKKHHHHHQRALSTGSPIPSPTLFSPRHLVLPTASDQQMGMSNGGLKVSTGKESPVTNSNAQESLEHNLPDSPFASPTKASSDYFAAFSNGNATREPERETTNINSSPTLIPPSSLDMASFQSFNCQPSRFSSGHGAIGMFAGTGGSTFPVGI